MLARSLIRNEYLFVGLFGVLEIRPHLGLSRTPMNKQIAMTTSVLHQMNGADSRRQNLLQLALVFCDRAWNENKEWAGCGVAGCSSENQELLQMGIQTYDISALKRKF